jgi:hypothetical protein
MANKIYLDLVNSVLVRLREDEVQTIGQNAYSRLISKFVNDGKRQVEDAYSWNSLRNTITVTTSNNTTNYSLVGSGVRFKIISVIDDTNNRIINNIETAGMKEWLLTNPSVDQPLYYNFNGVDSNNDTKVDFYPTPNGSYDIKFNVFLPTEELVNNTDLIKIPSEPVIFYAYAKALAERGEDGGIQSGEAYQLYLQSLADHIAIESSRTTPDLIWTD